MTIQKEVKSKMDHSIEHLQHELQALRTGRANPAMVTGIKVNIYGTEMRLQEIASVNAEAQVLLIMPYDKSSLQAIGKAIHEELQLLPEIDKELVRLRVPPMDDQRRRQMARKCKELGEAAKVSIRNDRQQANKRARQLKSDGDLAEDELNRIEKEVQTLTDQYCKKVDELCAKKEAEVLAV